MTVRSATVIGGGIVGLAVAEKLARSGIDTTVLEKEAHWAAHQTGHNSGVIHAGPYYKPGSLKATLCSAGNRSMVAFAREHGIAHDVCGKLIVAASADELPRLEVLHERALANGADARVITAEEAREYEPNVATVGALRVENTGIIDYSQVTATLARLAQEHGAT
ncbi:MAG: FAD-dependent oxidoreductase, partial [Lacisediminihabitans sp.]